MKDLTLKVCPHDTVHNPEGWYRLVQYLTARLGTKIHFEISLDFAEFHGSMTGASVVYANPSDAIQLLDAHHFCPLLRPGETYDEAMLVAGPDGPLPELDAINGAVVASVENLLPTKIALKMLRERGITPASVAHHDSWLSVVRSVWNGESPFGILYQDAYNELSPQGRAMIRVLQTTSERSAFHMFTARPDLCDDLSALTAALTAMHSDPEGMSVMRDITIPAWIPISDDEMTGLRAICA
ncbi:phosphate/phosphite/phosphonate ABC transporter substrate-binding protein [Oscillochloris sp. ZM17-4]|uniref:phosphate/phosphite/phosphonate ABC transporter substrate-binding protein n=1 Tax=Oscillochloris sp. ZM17-4 TaxID=2866714 RepID=UPI001C736868|nr:PhnD/SsuA/transferrin family substrate-binding protein [Oscillochloris sp. ZM17-4]MBX0329579.1 phosphate/phosphite/phosphonate ABC transporter substrate-binding protein [Oscillochloris sp. ZM17-4]